MDTSPAGQTPAKQTVRFTIDLAPSQHAELKACVPASGYTTLAAWTRALWIQAIQELRNPSSHPAYKAGYAAGQKEMQARVAASITGPLPVTTSAPVAVTPVMRTGLPTQPPTRPNTTAGSGPY